MNSSEKINDLLVLINHYKKEKSMHLNGVKDSQKSIDNSQKQIDQIIRNDLSVDTIKTITAIREPIPTFFCAKESGITRQSKCNEQCAMCSARIATLTK